MTETAAHDGLLRSLLPQHYELHIFDMDVTKDTFGGTVAIDLDCTEETNYLELNINNIEIVSVTATIEGSDAPLGVGATSTSEKEQKWKVEFTESIPVGSKLHVLLKYIGQIQNNMTGFYRSDYTDVRDPSQKKVCLSTQFEAPNLRTLFPCLDEPNFKATFGVTLTVPEEWTLLSNMPVKDETPAGDGLKTVSFLKSVRMSTYLVAWACGEFCYVETKSEKSFEGVGQIPIRVYTKPGLEHQTLLALKVAQNLVDFFSKIFDIDYPLPKLDLISIPLYSHGAMENYGLITFRETTLLFDPEHSEAKYEQIVLYVISHEIAHQWFGNLVTMNWWDELWLNEGFATWVGYLAVDTLFPEWDYFAEFLSNKTQNLLDLDALRGSHPVEVPIKSVFDIGQVFDLISYDKGASVINMLSNAIGIDVFLKGVSIYLKKHKFGNARTDDLWSGIAESSGTDINKFMAAWIGKIGFPYLSVTRDGEVIKVSQKRFLAAGDATEEEDQINWWVPLDLVGDKTPKFLEGRSEEFSVSDLDFVKLNKDSFGFYRVSYDDLMLELIFLNFDKLSVRDKVGLVADNLSLAIASIGKTSRFLSILKNFKGETSQICWIQILNSFTTLRKLWFEQPQEVQQGIQKFERELLSNILTTVGLQAQEGESYSTKALRMDVLMASGGCGVDSVTSYARELFDTFKATGKIESSMRSFVFQTVLGGDITQDDFDLVLQQLISPPAVDSREIAIRALAKVTHPDFHSKVLELLLGEYVEPMNAHLFGICVANNNTLRWPFWNFMKLNYKELHAKLSTNIVVWERFLKSSLQNFASEAAHEEIDTFFKDTPKDGFDRAFYQLLDQVKTNSLWVQNDAKDVHDWLSENKYL